jgi:hypothetical protein
MQLLEKQRDKKINYLFLGSSRVENGINPILIEEKLGKSSLNLGFQSSKLIDIYTVLKLINEFNIKIDTCFIQIDYIFNITEGNSAIFSSEIIPFYNESKVVKNYFNRVEPHNLYFIPFYRYMKFDSKIGFRKVFSTVFFKSNKNIMKYNGFVPLDNQGVDFENTFPNMIIENNPYFDSIVNFVKLKNINTVYFCAPTSKNVANLDYVTKLKEKIPKLYDFSTSIDDNTLFTDGLHLNLKGANLFTEIFLDSLTKRK